MITTKQELAAIQISRIDALGALLAQIATLQKQADAIKDEMKDIASRGSSKIFEGELFKATYIETNRSSVDYKKMCADLGIGDDVVKQYTKTSAVFSVKVTSR
jgi:hypothetical protein